VTRLIALVPVSEAYGPLGVMELEVLTPENTDGLDFNEVWTECGHPVALGDVVGWFNDGYQSKSVFCHRDIVATGEVVEYRFFASEAEAWKWVGEQPVPGESS
jgi:hypothetical protein